jgi:phosphatidylinositol-3-phosphatase
VTHSRGRRRYAHAVRVTTRRRGSAGRRRLAAGLANVMIGVSVLGACSTASPPVPTSCATAPATAATQGTAHASEPHIMVLVMENESYDQLIGNSAAPYINSLASSYLRATCSYANAHNSLPNYLEMISGRDYEASGTPNDCTPSSCGPIAGADIADQLDAAAISWRAFMGAMPSDCEPSDSGGSGGYVVRHNPFVYFLQGRTSPECGDDVPAADLLAALNSSSPPDFVFYSPSICEDGGNDAPCSTIANGDRFLDGLIPEIMATSWYRDAGTIILTWDEGSGSDTSGRYGDTGGHVLSVVISATTRGGEPSDRYVDPAGILRTVEDAYGLSYLGAAAQARSGSLPILSDKPRP